MPPSIFARHSSEIDWCEANYLHSEYVAEYYNTVTNIAFLLVGPLMMYLLHPYACRRSLTVHLVWIMFTMIGLFSMYYHMTLSFFGQLLDEISILWVICLGYSIWLPKPYFPRFIKGRSEFGSAVFVVAVASTLMSLVKPTINAYVLNSITFHILYLLVKEIRKCSDRDIINLTLVSICLWLVAISCWLSDRLFCNFWKRVNFCYLHSFWHIFICLAVAYINTVFAYFDAQYEIPECTLQLQYWPFKSKRIGLPYLAITKTQVSKKNC
ncbi:alkaline ceramidase 1 [Rhinoderma darwinii]|uniref:alkaline ceramidase 1 n=1 Tax=Rhinoderma darwinii TaxID=43563 RepID=UPI003F664FCA